MTIHVSIMMVGQCIAEKKKQNLKFFFAVFVKNTVHVHSSTNSTQEIIIQPHI